MRSPADWRSLVVTSAAGGLAVVATCVHLRLMGGTTFYVDEWSAIFEYDWSLRSLFQPVNGHNAYFGRILWYATMGLFGISDYLPFRVLGLGFNLFTAFALCFYAYRRAGVAPALGLTALVLFLGSSFHTVLWPASAVGLFSMGALVLTLLCLERGGLKANLGAFGLILLALGTGAMGIVVYAAASVEIGLRRRLGQFWVVAAPPVAYAVWLAATKGAGATGGFSLTRVWAAPNYIAQSSVFAVSGLLGRGTSLRWLWLGVYLLLVVVLMASNRRRIDFIRIASLATSALAFWGLTAVFRGTLAEVNAPRYIAFGAIPLALILVEVSRGMDGGRLFAASVFGLTVFSLSGNVPMLSTAGANFRYLGEIHRAQLGALEIARATIDPQYVPPGEWARYVKAESYFSAIDRFGSPGMSPTELRRASDAARSAADEVMTSAQRLSPVRASSEACDRSSSGEGFAAAAGSATVLVNQPEASVEVRLRRLAPTFPRKPQVFLGAEEAVRLMLWPDRLSGVPWHIGASAPMTACLQPAA